MIFFNFFFNFVLGSVHTTILASVINESHNALPSPSCDRPNRLLIESVSVVVTERIAQHVALVFPSNLTISGDF